ncbi:MAG: hypothetical protein IKX40_01700, partial [Thermoguttaceae bacterium]|nr:hypothetical protein [Thermoguttaceae bacterium]
MKRILSLTLGFAALSLIGCPPPVQPTSTGTATGTAPATEAVVEEIIEETVVEEVVDIPNPPVEEAPAVEEPAAPAEEAPAVEEPAAPAEEAPAVEEPAAPAEEAPAVEEPAAPAEEAPAVEEPAAPAEEAPAVEEAPAAPAEEAPAVEEAPAAPAEEAPAVEEAPAAPAEEAPAVEEAPAAEEAAAADRANPPQPKVELNPAFKPAIYATLPDYCPVPDGMTLDEKTNIIYLNCPNYVPADENGKREFNACLMQILPDGTVEKILEYPTHPETGKIGSMGIDICPSGNLYVCDNQRFSTDPQGQVPSRILRIARDENGKVIFDENGKPDVKVVIEGLNLANALLWDGDNLYITDTVVPTQGDEFGRGGIWKFTR